MPYKLLIVDDEYEIRHGISNYFPWDELGFTVADEAENGQEALDYVRGHQVDVILCDIKMPVKSGLELARELHRENRNIKIVFLSGYKDFEYVKEALVFGAKNYIVKPTKYKELADVFGKIKDELDREANANTAAADSQTAKHAGSGGDDAIIAKIKAYVEQHFRTVCLKDIARVVHMNPYYVSTYFKKKTGLAFSDYLIATKMRKAAEYLADRQYKMYEISELVGYGNPKNFSKSFKAYYGKNPREFRLDIETEE